MSGIETLSTTWLWFHLIAIATITYALRSSFIALFSYYDVPAQLEDVLELVPPAVFAALAVPPLLYRDGTYYLSPTNPFLIAGLAAGVVSWKTESLFRTIATGFTVFVVVTYAPIL
ncbi:AzlD domain-containing protein [Halorarius litoreus]|uniref:AzlD domain-containing protein n=1 Tax=Halorarius litoreus TaxID=2962676 RepID=UPI0020CEF4B1|nr:AzlD domain-containing protein [Halorarius litoreus]